MKRSFYFVLLFCSIILSSCYFLRVFFDNDSVYIIPGNNYKVYHNKQCEGLSNSKKEIIRITEKEAKEMNRYKCGYCYTFNPDSQKVQFNEAIKSLKYDSSNAIYMIRELNHEKYIPATRQLGMMCLNGEYIQKDVETGIELLKKAANKDTCAMRILGEYYYNEKNWSEAIDHLKTYENNGGKCDSLLAIALCENGDLSQAQIYANRITDSWLLKGKIYYKMEQYSQAYISWKNGIDCCDNNSCRDELGKLFYKGGGLVRKNYKEAYKLFSEAFEKDSSDIDALYYLGRMYYYGEYVVANLRKAEQYLYKVNILDPDNIDAANLYVKIQNQLNRPTRYCRNCNRVIPIDFKYCQYCGENQYNDNKKTEQ